MIGKLKFDIVNRELFKLDEDNYKNKQKYFVCSYNFERISILCFTYIYQCFVLRTKHNFDVMKRRLMNAKPGEYNVIVTTLFEFVKS